MAKKGQNLVNGIDGVNGLPAIDFNAATREVQDAFIECQPSISDPSGTAQYGANNEIKQYLDLQTISRASAFICSGSGNAYVLTTDTAVHLRQFTFIQKYSKIHFIASFTNTGACTVNVDFFGIKSIRLADGSDPLAGYITANNRYTMYYNGTNWILTNPTISITYIKQLIILSNNVTNPNTRIDFASGNFAFSDGSGFANLSAITKRLDANFAIGTNQGGLDTGSKANSTWYYCYAIYNLTTQVSDVIFSTNSSSPALPSGFTKYKYIGAIKTNVSGNIVPFFQIGNKYEFVDFITNYSGIPTSDVFFTQSLSVPKLNNIGANCYMESRYLGGDIVSLAHLTRITGTTGSNIVGGGATTGYTSHISQIHNMKTNSNGEIDFCFRYTAPADLFSINTSGFYDYNL